MWRWSRRACGDASSTVNSPIDSPVSSGSVSDRPLISWIFSDEEALQQYHETYSQFVSEVIESGWLQEEITRVSALIRPYVEADANSFYTVDEFDKAVEALQSYCAIRGESIRGQLDGTIPSTSEGQRADSSALVDAGSLTLSDMGVMNTGGGGPGNGGGPGGGMPSMPGGSGSGSGMPSMPGSGGFGFGSFSPPDGSSFTPPDNAGTDGNSFDFSSFTPPGTESGETEGTKKTAGTPPSRPDSGSGGPPSGFDPFRSTGSSSAGMPWSTFAIFAAVFLATILPIAKLPGRER